MNNLEDLNKEIEAIKARNFRVDTDKAWETSWTRRILISTLTYVIAYAWLVIISESSPYLKAVIPTAGYILSTISVSKAKMIWVKSRDK